MGLPYCAEESFDDLAAVVCVDDRARRAGARGTGPDDVASVLWRRDTACVHDERSRFDPAVTANSGDVWAETVNPNATCTPITLTAGQTATIMLTFIPSATKGTAVRGFIGAGTFNIYTLAGDELVNIPCTYTVG